MCILCWNEIQVDSFLFIFYPGNQISLFQKQIFLLLKISSGQLITGWQVCNWPVCLSIFLFKGNRKLLKGNGYTNKGNSLDMEIHILTGWPRTLENREMVKKKIPAGKKIREFEILLKIREKSGNFKKSYLCKVKIFKFYSCSAVATGGFFLPYA